MTTPTAYLPIYPDDEPIATSFGEKRVAAVNPLDAVWALAANEFPSEPFAFIRVHA